MRNFRDILNDVEYQKPMDVPIVGHKKLHNSLIRPEIDNDSIPPKWAKTQNKSIQKHSSVNSKGVAKTIPPQDDVLSGIKKIARGKKEKEVCDLMVKISSLSSEQFDAVIKKANIKEDWAKKNFNKIKQILNRAGITREELRSFNKIKNMGLLEDVLTIFDRIPRPLFRVLHKFIEDLETQSQNAPDQISNAQPQS